ncbi:MAG: FprA family A-type flavoprotein [Candidatus Anammoxibacter sp.]
MKPVKIKEDVYWVGSLDPDLVVFDIVVPTEHGTTYNAYLVKGKDKIALIDTVKEPFKEEYIKTIGAIVDPKDIDYIVINHTEPDHSGALPHLVDFVPNITTVFSKTAKSFVGNILHKEFNSIVVGDGDKIDLGGKTLSFISAPFLHWPDTMFTYIEEDKILFPCDAFGSHYCSEKRFNDELKSPEEVYKAFEFYYKCILRPFKDHIVNALEKIKDLDIDIVAPSHGPILRTNANRYIEDYRKWAYRTKDPAVKKKLVIIYVSSYGNTEKMAKSIARGTAIPGIEMSIFNATEVPMDVLVDEVEISDGIILGTPTLNAKTPEPIFKIISSLVTLNVKGKAATVFGCYGWSGEAIQMTEDILKSLKFKIIVDSCKLKMVPTIEELKGCEEFGRQYAKELLKQ